MTHSRKRSPLARARGTAIAVALALAAMACGSPPSSTELGPVFTPEESDAPAVNRIVTVALSAATTDGDELVLAIEAESIDRLFGGTFTLTYDSSLVSAEAVAPGDLLADGFLVSSLGSENEIDGELRIDFSLSAPAPATEVSGTLATVTLRLSAESSSTIGYKRPDFWRETRVRALVAADGLGIAGTRWLGGAIDWSESE